jgi:hypothetical protein
MAPWDEPSSKTCYESKMAFLQMEKEKDANKAAKEMMNRIRELFHALDDEEVLEGRIYEESYQEDANEDPNETFDEEEVLIYALPFDENI